jgi:hypothetical protein
MLLLWCFLNEMSKSIEEHVYRVTVFERCPYIITVTVNLIRTSVQESSVMACDPVLSGHWFLAS